MATIATVNTSDKVLLPAATEAYMRALPFGANWEDVRIGIFYTMVSTGSDDAACTSEFISHSVPADFFSFGLKDSSTNLPAAASSQFLGIIDNWDLNLASNSAGAGWWGRNSGSPNIQYVGTNGTGYMGGTGGGARCDFPQFSTTNVNTFLGLRFTVSNRGTSSQTVNIKGNHGSTTALTDVTKEALRTKLFDHSSFTLGNATITWNSGGTAMPLPQYFYIRSPFANSRVRITTYGAARVV